MSVYLGIDIGTSGTKTIAMQEDGKILATATENYPLYSPKPGWSEQEPEDWWQACVKGIQSVVAKANLKPDSIKGIGLSGQMHGSVFLDKKKEVIRPALLWNDQRTASECAEIEELAGGRKKLIKMVANPALTGFTAPKILWLRNKEKKNYDKLAQILLPKDYIRFRLTGEYATEVSDASGTLLLDVAKRQWSSKLLDKLSIDPALLPKVYESEVVSATLSSQAGEILGLPAGVPVVGGAADNAAAALGSGIVKKGAVFASMGTSGVVFAHSDEMAFDEHGRVHTFCHAVKGKWCVLGCILSAGGAMQWYRNQLADAEATLAEKEGRDVFDVLTQQASMAPIGSEGLFFLPYLTGERTPHADPYARAAWVGMSLRHGKSHLVRSVMEGATYAMRDALEIVKGMQIPVKEIRLTGGGGKSPLWKQIQADIYGQAVSTINAEEGPAYGVALLAATGTGAYKSVEEACKATISVVESTPADKANKKAYDKFYPLYQNLYASLKPNYREIAKAIED